MTNLIAEKDHVAYKQRLLAETRADLLKRQLSNSENYDKAVLSLSTIFLGLSLTFLKDFVSIQQVVCPCLLYYSWITFGIAILSTIVSFWVSQYAINVQLKKAEDYYLNDVKDALNKSWSAKITDWVNIISGVLFVLGVSLTIAFVIVNFERSKIMDEVKKTEQISLREGTNILKKQEVPKKKGASIPNLQPTPENQPAHNQPPNQSDHESETPNNAQSGSNEK